MKFKAILCILTCVWSLGYTAASVDSVQKTLDSNNISGKVVSSTDLDSGLSMIILNINDQQVPFLASNDGKVLFQPDSLLIQDKNVEARLQSFYKDLYEKQKVKINAKLKDVFKKQDKYVFHFKATKPSNKTIYIVSDPNCPYCQKEFQNISKRLENTNVEMIVVGFLGEDSMLKAAHALKEKSGNQSKDMVILKKLYTPHSKVQNIDTKEASALTQTIAAVGVHSVPYIIEE